MRKRFVSIWFSDLKTDWFSFKKPALKNQPFVLVSPEHGRMIITAANALVQNQGVYPGMVVADARAIIPSLNVFDDKSGISAKLLKAFAEWCIRFTPFAAIDLPDGIILDATGCAHLWGGEKKYVEDIVNRLNQFGYHVQAAMTDTIGSAWALSRFGEKTTIVESGQHMAALFSLPPAALRLEPVTIERLEKLGLRKIKDFISMPRSSLCRRFGQQILLRLDQATGHTEELISPAIPVQPYQERLPCLDPIVTAAGIEIALQRLLENLCNRLKKEEKGIRKAYFKAYRVDGKIEQISITTSSPSYHAGHLFKLFSLKIATIAPALGIELFIVEADKVEQVLPFQQNMWKNTGAWNDAELAELIDRLAIKIGAHNIHRFEPDEHYWPERSYKHASSLHGELTGSWKTNKPRPLYMLPVPQPVQVAAPVPDYPPMLFRFKGNVHHIKKADGPERIEQEWWLQQGEHRDYYTVEDEKGRRYWLFRSGHYNEDRQWQWFIHGFFA